jgi:amino acid permease
MTQPSMLHSSSMIKTILLSLVVCTSLFRVGNGFDGQKLPAVIPANKFILYRNTGIPSSLIPSSLVKLPSKVRAQVIDDSDNLWLSVASAPWDMFGRNGATSSISNARRKGPFFRSIDSYPFPVRSQQKQNKGSVVELTVSLVKSIVGGGVLAIPAAVSTLGDSPEQVLPIAVLLILVMGAINAYYFSLMGKVCEWTGTTTFSQAWECTMGSETSSLFASIISIKTALSCIAYSMILGESFQSLALSAGFIDVTRTDALLAVTLTALVPLCLLKDLSSLAPFSFAGILGFAYTGAAMMLRAHDGSYHLAPIDAIESGRFLIDIPDPYKPCFGETGPTVQGLALACTLATAFVSHYNAPRFYNELDQKEQFNAVTYTSFGISAAVMAIIAVAGFTTFGAASAPVILNNYSPHDPLIFAGRVAIAASLVATFPFPFFGLRDSILDAMAVPVEHRNSEEGDMKNMILTISLLVVITTAALSVNDLSLLLSVGGGTIATAVYSVFPTIMFQAAVLKQQNQSCQKKPYSHRDEKSYAFDLTLATSLMKLCVLAGATGVGLSIYNHGVH